MIRTFRDLYRNRAVPFALIFNQLRRGTAGTRLGHLWWFLDPIIMMAIYYMVVVGVFERGGPDYHLFILSALIAWQWFARSVQAGTGAFRRSANIVKETSFPGMALVVTPLITNLIYALVGFVVVLLFALRMPTLDILWLPVIVIVQVLFTLAITPFLAIINVLLPDTERAIGFILRAWWFLSPVLYSAEMILEAERVPEWAKILFQMNPFTILLPAYRYVLTGMGQMNPEHLLILGGASLVVMQLSFMAFRRMESRIKKFL